MLPPFGSRLAAVFADSPFATQIWTHGPYKINIYSVGFDGRNGFGERLFTRVVEAPTPTEVRKEPKGFDLIFTKMKPVGGAAAVWLSVDGCSHGSSRRRPLPNLGTYPWVSSYPS